MGKVKDQSPLKTEFTLVPEINDSCRTLALQQIYGGKQIAESDPVNSSPRIITISHKEATELGPLKRVPPKQEPVKSLGTRDTSPVKPPKRRQSLGPILDRKSSNFDIHSTILEKCMNNNLEKEDPLVDPFAKKEKKKDRRMSFPEYNSETFTFHPKVSEQSTKIIENLGTDFMSRQQQHIEKQKKHVEQANLHYRATNPQANPGGNTSPVQKRRMSRDLTKDVNKSSKEQEENKDEKENEKENTSPRGKESASPRSKDATSPRGDSSNTSIKQSRSNTTLAPVRAPKKVLSQNSGLGKLEESPYSTTFHKQRKRAASAFKGAPEADDIPVTSRSKTMPPPDTGRRLSRKVSMTMLDLDRLKNAKLMVDKAVKTGKIFTIQGPYSKVRASLRKRGWVEKFYKMQPKRISWSVTADDLEVKKTPRKKSRRDDTNDDNDDDDDDDGDSSGADDDLDDKTEDKNYREPWEEDGGVYGIMSRMIRNSAPSLIWCLRRDSVDYRFLGKDQMVNHYCRAGSFTTKVGLCMNMRNVPWFENEDPDTFFPRCYRLSADDDKDSFIADYRLTACMSVIKLVIDDHERRMLRSSQTRRQSSAEQADKEQADEEKENGKEETKEKENSTLKKGQKAKKKPPHVPLKCLEIAMVQCEKWLQSLDHQDIDDLEDPNTVSEEMWEQFLKWYYQLIHEGAVIMNADSRVHECDVLVDELRDKFPQFDLDGTRNTWIVKPGAKSRGRGIMVLDRLDEMLKLVAASVVKKEGKWVVMKYIERPLLVYNTKFDIRQWFLVTDWNPLTVYFYQDSYLRFCSQQYTLDKFDEAIHLANNSIQKHYSNDKTRSSKLPNHNMWSHYSFKDYLAERGEPHAWDDVIYPGMKRAIHCALLTTQDFVEYRKAAFELYGADFMLTEDLRPWLIEINSSPAMDPSTPVTAKLCTNVLDDVMKVVVDRRYDRSCDIGRFELSYRQTAVNVPPYIGINLAVEGTGIRRPGLQPHPIRPVPLPAPKLLESEQPPAPTKDQPSPYAMPLTHSKSTTNASSPGKTASGTLLYQKTSLTDQRTKKETKEPETSSSNKDLAPQPSQQSPNKSVIKREKETVTKKEKSQSTNVLKGSVATVVDLKKPLKQQGASVFVDDGAWGRICDRCGSAMSTRHDDCPCSTPHGASRGFSPSRSQSRSPSRARSARVPLLQPSCVSLSSQFYPPKPPTRPPLSAYYQARIPKLSVIRQEIRSLETALHGPPPPFRAPHGRRQSTPGHLNNDNFPRRLSQPRKSRHLTPLQLSRNHQLVASMLSQGYYR